MQAICGNEDRKANINKWRGEKKKIERTVAQKSSAAGMAEAKTAPKMAKSAGSGSCGTFLLCLFHFAPRSPGHKRQQQPDERSGWLLRLLVVDLSTRAAFASRLSTSVPQRRTLKHSAMLPEPFVPVDTVTPDIVCLRRESPQQRHREARFSSTTSIHPASIVGTTQEMQRKISLRHLSKVSV